MSCRNTGASIHAISSCRYLQATMHVVIQYLWHDRTISCALQIRIPFTVLMS